MTRYLVQRPPGAPLLPVRTAASLRRALALCLVLTLSACGSPEPEIPGAEPSLWRLTEQQYRNIISDLFGEHIIVSGRFDPILRQDGLRAIGAAGSTISASSFDQFEKIARAIADQVVSEGNRSLYLPCEPADPQGPDAECARSFLEPVGRFLYRRPLAEQELEAVVALANRASEQLTDFHEGLAFGLTSLLVNPNFLFVVESATDSPGADGRATLTAHARAARLSFFLWNTTPDEALLASAESGELLTDAGLSAQVDRMLRSPRLREGIASLFTDMLHLDEFEHLEKEPSIYPAMNPQAIEDARTQLLLTIQNHLLDADADYRTLFTTRDTFINGSLGRVYRAPVAEPAVWSPYRFADTEKRGGIQTLAGFVALHSHPGRSSPTIRGKAVRELLLCQTVPDPPGDVDFSLFNAQETQDMTARERLAAHNAVPSCAGCHKITDGIGLSLENYDGAGQYRVRDNGHVIDASGKLDGMDYEDPLGLGEALKENPAVPTCLVEQTVAYGLGRAPGRSEHEWLEYLAREFEEADYRFLPLLRSIVSSENFYAVKAPGLLTVADR